MRNNSIKLYNLIFPIWFLWLIPITWLVVLPANFLIDLLVVSLTMKYLKVTDIKVNAKSVIFRVWIFGFIADFIGTASMFMASLFDINYETHFGKWWYNNISNPVSYNPFESIYSILWVTVCVIITAFLIYLFNYKFCLKKSNLDHKQKKELALSEGTEKVPFGIKDLKNFF